MNLLIIIKSNGNIYLILAGGGGTGFSFSAVVVTGFFSRLT